MYDYKVFNVKPSPFDHRDKTYSVQNVSLKPQVDLRKWDNNIKDQGRLGSCVSHALTSAYELIANIDQTEKSINLSRLFSYYHTRYIEQTIDSDSGVTYMRNALKAAASYGTSKETLWPYIVEKYREQPSPDSYLDAAYRKIINYRSLVTVTAALEALNWNRPILVGVVIFDGFISLNKENSTMIVPRMNRYIVGGHAMSIVGYNLEEKQFIVKNSYGTQWGDDGYCLMPFDYYEQFVFEKWIFDLA